MKEYLLLGQQLRSTPWNLLILLLQQLTVSID